MGTLSRDKWARFWHFFNLMRNIGGSIGIASITTLVTRQAQASQADLVWHMSSSIPTFTTTRSSPDRSCGTPATGRRRKNRSQFL